MKQENRPEDWQPARRRELPAAVVAGIAIRGAPHHLATPFTSSLKETWRGVQSAKVALTC